MDLRTVKLVYSRQFHERYYSRPNVHNLIRESNVEDINYTDGIRPTLYDSAYLKTYAATKFITKTDDVSIP